MTVNGGRGSYISCYFRADENGEALLGGIANIEGSRFERGSSSVATVFSNSSNVYFDPVTGAYVNYSGDFVWNSQSDGIPLGNVEFGAFLNNSFPDRPDLSTLTSIVFLGAVTQVADGPTNPLPQLLFGSSYATPDGGGADSDGGVLTLGDAQRAGAGHPRAGRAHQLAHDASVHAPKPGRKGPGDSSPR